MKQVRTHFIPGMQNPRIELVIDDEIKAVQSESHRFIAPHYSRDFGEGGWVRITKEEFDYFAEKNFSDAQPFVFHDGVLLASANPRGKQPLEGHITGGTPLIVKYAAEEGEMEGKLLLIDEHGQPFALQAARLKYQPAKHYMIDPDEWSPIPEARFEWILKSFTEGGALRITLPVVPGLPTEPPEKT